LVGSHKASRGGPQHPGPTRGHQIQRTRVTPLLGTSSSMLFRCGFCGIVEKQLFPQVRGHVLARTAPAESCGKLWRVAGNPSSRVFTGTTPCPASAERGVQHGVTPRTHHRHHLSGSPALGKPCCPPSGQVVIERRAPALAEKLVYLTPSLIDQPGLGCAHRGFGLGGHPRRSYGHQFLGQSGQALSDRRCLPGYRGVLWRRWQRGTGHAAKIPAAPDSH